MCVCVCLSYCITTTCVNVRISFHCTEEARLLQQQQQQQELEKQRKLQQQAAAGEEKRLLLERERERQLHEQQKQQQQAPWLASGGGGSSGVPAGTPTQERIAPSLLQIQQEEEVQAAEKVSGKKGHTVRVVIRYSLIGTFLVCIIKSKYISDFKYFNQISIHTVYDILSLCVYKCMRFMYNYSIHLCTLYSEFVVTLSLFPASKR